MTTHELAVKANNEWYAYQNILELETALTVIKEVKPRIILEVGTAYMGSLAAWCEVANPELAISFDPLDLPRTPAQQTSVDNLIKQYNIKCVARYTRDPRGTEELERLLNGQKVDFLFIDAAHGFDDVKHDFYKFKEYVAPNGIIGLHDIFGCEALEDAGSGVNWLWERLKKKYNYDEFYYHSSMGIGFVYRGAPITPSIHTL